MEDVVFDEEDLFYKVADKGVDSVVFVTEKNRIFSLLKKLEIMEKLRLTSRNKAIQEWCKKKFSQTDGLEGFSGSIKHPYRVRYINFKRGGKSLTNTLILIENSDELNKLCKERKKKMGTYVMVVFAGLYQPSREIKPLTHKVLKAFLRKFNIWEMDYAVDIISGDEINNSGKDKFRDAVKCVSVDDTVFCEKTTIYVNNCKGDIKRVLIYDKFLKESTYHKQRLSRVLSGWRRIEMRVNVRKRFSKIESEEIDYYTSILDEIARKYNHLVLFGVVHNTLNSQLNYFKDGRRRIKSEVKFNEWIA